MAGLKQFERLVSRARGESPPQPSVAPAVLARLRRETAEPPAAPGSWMWGLSAVSACAAAACVVVGYSAWAELAGPWPQWISELSNWWAL